MSDTDSLVIEFTDIDPYEFMINNHEHFDLSNYPDNHFIFKGKSLSPSKNELSASEIKEIKLKNEKVLGKMKDKLGGELGKEFVGLKSKSYAFDSEKDYITAKKCKGIKMSVVQNEITIDDYRKMIFGEENDILKSMNIIRSRNHQINSETLNKIALTSPLKDNKNYVCSDRITRYPWGHYKINELTSIC
jgi:hypothetical protein